MKITGHKAVELAEANDLRLNKYADPTEDSREGLTPDQARIVAAEDPSLVYIDIPLLVMDEMTTPDETAETIEIRPFRSADGIRADQTVGVEIDDTALIRALYDHPSARAFSDGSYLVD